MRRFLHVLSLFVVLVTVVRSDSALADGSFVAPGTVTVTYDLDKLTAIAGGDDLSTYASAYSLLAERDGSGAVSGYSGSFFQSGNDGSFSTLDFSVVDRSGGGLIDGASVSVSALFDVYDANFDFLGEFQLGGVASLSPSGDLVSADAGDGLGQYAGGASVASVSLPDPAGTWGIPCGAAFGGALLTRKRRPSVG